MESAGIFLSDKFGLRVWRGMGPYFPAAPNKVGETMHAEIQELAAVCEKGQLDLGRGQSAAGLGLDPRPDEVDRVFKVDQGAMRQAVSGEVGQHPQPHRQKGQLVSRGAGENFQQFAQLFYLLVFDEQIVARKDRKFD